MAYCEPEDLILGSIPTPPDAAKYVELAAEEIDSRIGFKYATPVTVDDSPAARPTKLLLKRLNFWLASGRIVMALDSGGSESELHKYGLYLVNEVRKTLDLIASGELVLTGATPVTPDGEIITGPLQSNADPYSLVEGFGDVFGSPAAQTLETPRMPYPLRGNPYTW